jgi:hypothetical protein
MRLAQTLSLTFALMLTLTACPDGGGGNGDGGTAEDGGVNVRVGDFEPGTQAPGDPCNGTVDCTPGSICYSNICVQEGVLRFSLSWDVDTDFDLHVQTPGGDHIDFSSRQGGGGELDVDDCVAGACALPDNKHVENVFFGDTAAPGAYLYWVNNFDGDTAGAYTLVVAKDGVVQATKNGTLPATDGDSEMYSFTY